MDRALAPGVINGQIEQAYTKTMIATAAQGAADLLRQNIMTNLVQDTNSLAGLKLNDPAVTMLATARANATASTNASLLTMDHIVDHLSPSALANFDARVRYETPVARGNPKLEPHLLCQLYRAD